MYTHRSAPEKFRWLALVVLVLGLTFGYDVTASSRVITIGVVQGGWPPLLIIQSEQATGASIDFLNEVLDTGTPRQVKVFPDFASLMDAACSGTVDVVPVIQGTPPRTCVVTSDPYFDADTVIIGRETNRRSVRDNPTLSGQRIATEADSYVERVSPLRYPGASLVLVPNIDKGLQAIVDGQADFYITLLPVAEYVQSRKEYSGLTELNAYRETASSLHFGFPVSQRALRDTVNERLGQISTEARESILARWTDGGQIEHETASPFFLTPEEREYLRRLPPLQVDLDPGLAPYSYVDASGKASGIAVDYLRYLSKALGVTFVRKRLADFPSAVDALKAGRIDLLGVAVPRDPALRGAPVSRPYSVFPVVIVGGKDSPTVARMQDLGGKRVAVTDGGGLRSLVQSLAPHAKIVSVATIQDGMKAVEEHRADVYVDDLAAADYELQRGSGAKLRVIGSAEEQLKTVFAINPSLAPKLMPLINRALDALPDSERLMIQNRYFSARYTFETSWKSFLARIAPFGIAAFLTIAILLHSHRRLRMQVRERRAAERRLIELTSQIPAVIFQSTGGEGFLDQKMTWVSGRTEELFGKKPDELATITGLIRKTAHPDDYSMLKATLLHARAVMEPLTCELRLPHGEQWRWTTLHAVPSKSAEGVISWTGYWTNTDEEHHRKIALIEARDAAETASRAKDAFLAMMSHEIRTPMSGVLGLVEVLAQGELRGEQVSIVGMIHGSAAALLQILDDILDYSKIQAEKLTIESEPFDLRSICDLVMGLLSVRAHEKGLTMRCRVRRRVAARHRGDSVRLRQILFNLLSNSIKFTASGSISLEVDVENDTTASQTLRITVSDTGIGIEEEKISTLFSPFVQADSTTSRRFGGTGLGLAISNQLIKLMGGTIQIASKAGRGTSVTVRVALPVESHAQDDVHHLDKLRAVVLVSDRSLADDVLDGLSALGVHAKAMDRDSTSLLVPEEGMEAPNILIVDQDQLPPPLKHGITIHVTERPKASGYRLTEDDIRLSVNPLSFRGLRAVCHAALGEYEHVTRSNQHGSQQNGARPLIRTRDEALRDGALILVAEDNQVNRYLIQKQLQLLGCVCDAVEDGGEALKQFETTQYALVITDCHMPVINGYALASEIRERERAWLSVDAARAHLPIIGLTASVHADEHERCIRAGMDDRLRKPVQLDVLRACVARWAPVCFPENAPSSGETTSSVDPVSERGPTVVHPATGPDRALPPLDWQAICGGQSGASRNEKLIQIIVESLRSDAQELSSLVKTADPHALRQWIHRVSGTAQSLHYAPLAQVLADFRATVVGENDIELEAAASSLIGHLADIIDHLALQ